MKPCELRYHPLDILIYLHDVEQYDILYYQQHSECYMLFRLDERIHNILTEHHLPLEKKYEIIISYANDIQELRNNLE